MIYAYRLNNERNHYHQHPFESGFQSKEAALRAAVIEAKGEESYTLVEIGRETQKYAIDFVLDGDDFLERMADKITDEGIELDDFLDTTKEEDDLLTEKLKKAVKEWQEETQWKDKHLSIIEEIEEFKLER